MKKNEKLAQRLQTARVLKGWSQQDLAKQSGVAQAQISRYEAGTSAPRPLMASRLAQALNVSALWLLGSDAISEPSSDDLFSLTLAVPRSILNKLQLEADERKSSIEDVAASRLQTSFTQRASSLDTGDLIFELVNRFPKGQCEVRIGKIDDDSTQE